MSWRLYLHRVWLTTAVVAAVIVSLVLIATQAHALLVVFGGILFAIFLRALSGLIERYTPVRSVWALTLVFGLIVTFMGAGLWFGAPRALTQFRQLQSDLPGYLETLERHVAEFVGTDAVSTTIPEPSDVLKDTETVLGGVTTVFSTTFTFFFDLIIILILGAYFAFAPWLYTHGFLKLFPPNRRQRLQDVLKEVADTLSWWLVGRVAAMALVGVLTWPALRWLDVGPALALALIAALLTFVPYIGPMLGFVPIGLVTMPMGWQTFLTAMLLYGAIQSLEGYVFTPLILQRTVRLPPALTLVAQLLFGVLLGPIGVVFATPFAAAALVLVRMLYVEDVVEGPRLRPTPSELVTAESRSA